MKLIEKLTFAAVIAAVATPAFAGAAAPVPGPIAGVGVGAVVLIGIGYKALKSRIGR